MNNAGFSYVGLLILVAILSVVASATVHLGAASQRREAEQELLFVGSEFVAALRSYAAATPAGAPRFPRELDDLLRDPRVPDIRRHLRRIPVDPISGTEKWGLERLPDGSVVAVHSPSDAKPIKIGNFDPPFVHFERASKYSEWSFGVANSVLSGR